MRKQLRASIENKRQTKLKPINESTKKEILLAAILNAWVSVYKKFAINMLHTQCDCLGPKLARELDESTQQFGPVL